jgi:predicted RNA-binding Zn-ribbon protein involved in translation (DUF1610 family)
MATEEGATKGVLIRTHDGQRIKLRCPVCGDEAWLEAKGAPDVEDFQPILVANSKNKGMVYVSATAFFCGNCGYAAQFAQIGDVKMDIADDD